MSQMHAFLLYFNKNKFEQDILETNKKGPHNTKEGEKRILESRIQRKLCKTTKINKSAGENNYRYIITVCPDIILFKKSSFPSTMLRLLAPLKRKGKLSTWTEGPARSVSVWFPLHLQLSLSHCCHTGFYQAGIHSCQVNSSCKACTYLVIPVLKWNTLPTQSHLANSY